MGKFVFAVLVAVASLVLVESLTCNSCLFSVLGFCVKPSTDNCLANVTQCYTTTLKFPTVTNFNGFGFYGCATDNTTCSIATNNSLLTVAYTFNNTCCQTDKCNTIAVSGATTTKMTFTAAILASVLGSML
ncbi:uncharacterized protein LOC122843401 isoform X3 [Gambusia affinis]|uniref:uncharacterized protein LOC122843401 isoform X3 n=1 Tax=Gambusia affinis TaxID=33528 RepID=UPI001CDC3712|nr:uncharacterized protein LOC122843401 isoform X3 [Gambusia affinis]